MNRKTGIVGILLLLIGVAVFAAVQPSQAILGRLGGDAFLTGFPTRYWGSQLCDSPGSHAKALSSLREGGAESVGVLRELLRTHSDPEIRWTAAELLGQLGPVAHAASDDLIAATQDSDSHVRALAAVAIPKVETPVEKALPVLIPLLESEHAGVVARAISVYKSRGKAALPALVKLLNDESRDTETRWNASRALGKLGPEGIEALPVLIQYTTHAEETIREHSVEAIGDIGPTATAGIPAIIECLDDPAVRVRRDAVRSLGYMGAAAKGTVPQVKGLLADPEELVRDAAINALKAIAPEEVPAAEPSPNAPAAPENNATEPVPPANEQVPAPKT